MNILYKIINFLIISNTALADGEQEHLDFTIVNPLSTSGNVSDIINSIIDLMLKIGGPIAALMYVWAGFQFLTAGGDEKKIATAKKTLVWTTIGIAVLVMSKGIILAVEGILTP